MSDEKPGFALTMNTVYQLLAVAALAISGISEFVRMGDRISVTEKQLADIATNANRVPTIETRVTVLEADTLKRSGPVVDEIHTLERKMDRVDQIVLVERAHSLETLQKQIDTIQQQLGEHTKTDESIQHDIYQLELRRNGIDHPIEHAK